MNDKAIYVRSDPAHAWRFDRLTNAAMASLMAMVNLAFGLKTLIVPLTASNQALPQFIDAAHTQQDFLPKGGAA